MLLAVFLRSQGITFREFGRRVGQRINCNKQPVRATTIARWCQDSRSAYRRVPRGRYMDAVVKLTKGRVTPNDFRDLPDLRSPRAGERGARLQASKREASELRGRRRLPPPAAALLSGKARRAHGRGQ